MPPVCFPPCRPISTNTLVRSLSGTHDLKTDAATYFITEADEFAQKMLIDIILAIASAGIYGVFLMGKGIYDICTVEEKMQIKGESVNDLIHSITTRRAGETEIRFTFNHQVYKLIDNYDSDHVFTGMDLMIESVGAEENDVLVHHFDDLSLELLEQKIPCDDIDELSAGTDDVKTNVVNDERNITPITNSPQDSIMVSNQMMITTVEAFQSGNIQPLLASLWTAEQTSLVKGDPVNHLIHSLKTRRSDSIHILFNNQVYKLAECKKGMKLLIVQDDDEDNDILVHFFPDLSFDMLDQAAPQDDCYLATRQLHTELCKRLDAPTKEFFHYLLDPLKIHCRWRNPYLVLGNQDGSTPRLILSAMMAGYLDLDSDGLNLLAHAMKQEADNKPAQLSAILRHMKFRSGFTLFINLINGENNRLSTNQPLNNLIAKKLMAAGAKFISNHPRHRRKDGYCRAFWDPLTFQFYIPDGIKLVNVDELPLTPAQREYYKISCNDRRAYMTKYGVVKCENFAKMAQEINAGMLPARPDDFHPTNEEIKDVTMQLSRHLSYYNRFQIPWYVRLMTNCLSNCIYSPSRFNLNLSKPIAAFNRIYMDTHDICDERGREPFIHSYIAFLSQKR